MDMRMSPALKAKSRIVSSAIQCVVWAVLSVHSWGEVPGGLYFWCFLSLVALSLVIFMFDLMRYQRIRATGEDLSD